MVINLIFDDNLFIPVLPTPFKNNEFKLKKMGEYDLFTIDNEIHKKFFFC